MRLPAIDASELSRLLPGLQNVHLVSSQGQKRVFSGDFQGQKIAIKAILTGLTSAAPDEEEDQEKNDDLEVANARLKREIEILSKSQCPNLVRLGPISPHQATLNDEQITVYTEEWLPGVDLASRIRKGPLAREDVKRLGLALSSAVGELDQLGYLHRDIKPANILSREDDEFVLVDPGLAFDRNGTSLTAPGRVPGTVAYLAPERVSGTAKRQIDVRSDFFPIGVVLYEALTGKHPFNRKGMTEYDILTAIQARPHQRLTRADDPEQEGTIEGVIDRLLAKRAHLRFRDVSDLTTALRDAQ